ncbi:MAG: ATP-binding protein [Proteobacteria bacterium]|nr:ATP-binding protein [Pseudomonadota bacterium]
MGSLKKLNLDRIDSWGKSLPSIEHCPIPVCILSIPMQKAKKLIRARSSLDCMVLASDLETISKSVKVHSESEKLTKFLGLTPNHTFEKMFQSMLQHSSIEQIHKMFTNMVDHQPNHNSVVLHNQSTEKSWHIKFLDQGQAGNDNLYLTYVEDVSHTYSASQQSLSAHQVLEFMNDMVIVFNINGEVEYLNTKSRQTLDLPMETRRPTYFDLLDEESSGKLTSAINELAFHDQRIWTGNLKYLSKHANLSNESISRCQLIKIQSELTNQPIGFCLYSSNTKFESLTLNQSSQLQRHLIQDVGLLVTTGMVASKMLAALEAPIEDIHENLKMIHLSLASDAKKSPQFLENLKSIDMSLKKIGKISSSARSLTGQSGRSIHDHGHVKQVITELRELLSSTAVVDKVNIQFPEISDDITVQTTPQSLTQIMFNLVFNAFDAVQSLHEKWIEIHVALDHDWVTIHVVDSGHGIPDPIADQMFDRFFTTKSDKLGNGLGLHVSRAIIRDIGGDLYHDKVSPHTTFVLKIPRIDAKLSDEESTSTNWEEI